MSVSLCHSNRDMLLQSTQFLRRLSHRDAKLFCSTRWKFGLYYALQKTKHKKALVATQAGDVGGYIHARKLLGMLILQDPPAQEKMASQDWRRSTGTQRASKTTVLALTMMQSGCVMATLHHQERMRNIKWNVNAKGKLTWRTQVASPSIFY